MPPVPRRPRRALTHSGGAGYVAPMAKLPDPILPVRPPPDVAFPPPTKLLDLDPEECVKLIEEQRRREEETLKQLRSLRPLMALGGLASFVLCGLVISKLFNWHLAGWANLPELSAAGGIALTMIVRLALLTADLDERLEGAYSPQHRLEMVSNSIGVMLVSPLVLLAVGWLLTVLL